MCRCGLTYSMRIPYYTENFLLLYVKSKINSAAFFRSDRSNMSKSKLRSNKHNCKGTHGFTKGCEFDVKSCGHFDAHYISAYSVRYRHYRKRGICFCRFSEKCRSEILADSPRRPYKLRRLTVSVLFNIRRQSLYD